MQHAGTDKCKPEEKRSVAKDSGIDLDFSECERMYKLNQTKTETLAYNTDTMDNLEELELLQTFTCLESTGKHI